MHDITIIMPSYNKAKYISEALDSIFMQKTKYSYKVIVTDDCSTDDTIKKVQEYQNKYPGKIEILTSDTNQKLYKNIIRAYANTKSEYFCVLDPDDYWTDEYKIEKALNFLEKNKDYAIYVTNTMQKLPNGNITKYTDNKEQNSDFKDYLNGKAVLGCTLGSVYRNVVFKDGIPEKMVNISNKSCEKSFRGDSFRNAIHINKGKAHSVKDYDAVYRITEEGIWQGLTTLEQNLMNIEFFINMYAYFDEKYPELLLSAYKIFVRTQKELIALLSDENNKEKLKLILNNLYDFEKLFINKKSIIEKIEYKNIKLKYKILFYIYHYSYNILMKKGLLNEIKTL